MALLGDLQDLAVLLERLAELHVHLFRLREVHLVGRVVRLVLLGLVEVGLALLLGLAALAVQPPEHLLLHLVVSLILLVDRPLEVVDGVLVHEVDLVQVLGDELVREHVALREGELVVPDRAARVPLSRLVGHRGDEREEEHEEQGCELSEHHCKRVCLLLLMVLLPLPVAVDVGVVAALGLSLPTLPLLPLLRMGEEATAEEHFKYLLGVNLLLELALPEPPRLVLLTGLAVAGLLARQIVDLPLLGVYEAGVGGTHLLEGLGRLGRVVLVGVELDGQLLIGLLDLLLRGALLQAQDIVVVLLLHHFFAELDLVGRVLGLLRLGRGHRL